MTADWNNSPIEMKVMIISEMDFISRARLGSCAKREQQLVRNTPCKIEKIEIEKSFILLNHGNNEIGIKLARSRYFTHSLFWKKPAIPSKDLEPTHLIKKTITPNWKNVVMKMFNTIGSKCVVGKLVLNIEVGSEDKIVWFRENVNFEPMTVEIAPIGLGLVDRFLEWPQNVKIICNFHRCYGPYLEKLNSYDNIVKFMSSNERMTDEKLMKMPNATSIFVEDGDFTDIGITRWLKQWLVRPDFDKLFLSVWPSGGRNLNYLKIETELEGFITSVDHKGYGTKITLKNQSNGKVGELQLCDGFIEFMAGNE